jgi:HAD superfamily phosphoserine phosphatase-like hydrolase
MVTDQANTAAFIRVEGTLTSHGAVSAAAYFAANARGFRERAFRFGQVALTAPLYRVLGQSDRILANRLVYVSLRNMDQDRIHELAAEYFETILKEAVLEGGIELIRRARRLGHRIVLISDGLANVIEPLVEHLRHVDDCICNRLEFRDGVATGRLLEPIVGGHDSARWAGRYAEEHGIDLEGSIAYAAHGPDVLLLSEVGFPCAVNPDFTLRQAARQARWPIMDYRV